MSLTEKDLENVNSVFMVDMMSSLQLVDVPVGGRLKRGYLE